MSTTKFMTATGSNRELQVRKSNEGSVQIRHYDADHETHQAKTFFLNPTDAPALALAILEAAGVEPSSPHYGLNDSPEWNVRWASHYLGRSIELTEAKTAEAKEQAELEAEALELYKAHTGYTHAKSLSEAATPERWLAVARRAREMRAEK